MRYSTIKLIDADTREVVLAIKDSQDKSQPYGILMDKVVWDSARMNELYKDINIANVHESCLDYYTAKGVKWTLNPDRYTEF